MLTLWHGTLLIPIFPKWILNSPEYVTLLQASLPYMEELAFKLKNPSRIQVWATPPYGQEKCLSAHPKKYTGHCVPCLPACRQVWWRVRFSEGCSLSMKFKQGKHYDLRITSLPPFLWPSPPWGCLKSHPQQGTTLVGSGELVQAASWGSLFCFSTESCHLLLRDCIHLQCRRLWFDSWVRKIPWRRDGLPVQYSWVRLVAQLVKNPPAMRETWVRSLGCKDPPEKGKATHYSILAWRIPWTE